MSPLEARDHLLRFGRTRGESAFRLAMHASVPQSFRADLLHLLCLNFVPDASRDAVAETDVLLAEFSEENAGYYRFDPAVRGQLQTMLESEYATDGESRIQRVAALLSLYTEHCGRARAEAQDALLRQHLEVQRWVALSYLDPDSAAAQLAAALRRSLQEGDSAARLKIGGLVSSIAQPLARHSDLLVYAKGLEAAESGDVELGRELLGRFGDAELEIGGVKLPPAPAVLRRIVREPARAQTTREGPRLPVNIYISHAREDERLVDECVRNLSILGEGIRIFYDQLIQAGEEWEKVLHREMESADLFLLMVSADYLGTRYGFQIEVPRAIERAQAGTARVIPIILRACYWEGTPLAQFDVLPRDGRPVDAHRYRPRVWQTITQELAELIQQIRVHKPSPPVPDTALKASRPAVGEATVCVIAGPDARKDVDELQKHVTPFIESGEIRTWSLQEVGWRDISISTPRISTELLQTADVFVVLMTQDLFRANPLPDLQLAFERARGGDARVVLVILEPVPWQDTTLADFHIIPPPSRPVRDWKNQDEAWQIVAEGILQAVRSVSSPPKRSPAKSQSADRRVLTDAEAAMINFDPQERTVEQLIDIRRPGQADPRSRRRFAAERQTYRVRCRMVACKVSKTSAIHMMLQGDTGASMKARIPSPSDTRNSNFSERFEAARQLILREFLPESFSRDYYLRLIPQKLLHVTGVGYFAQRSGQAGMAPNGLELHPVLKIEVEPSD
jgi:hypothetical protein